MNRLIRKEGQGMIEYGLLAALIMNRLSREEEGQSMIEYGLLAALISIAAIAAIKLIGPSLTKIFQGVADGIGS